jgi:hypothetical protein
MEFDRYVGFPRFEVDRWVWAWCITGVVGNTAATGVGDCWGDTNAADQVEITSIEPSASTVSPRIGSGGAQYGRGLS